MRVDAHSWQREEDRSPQTTKHTMRQWLFFSVSFLVSHTTHTFACQPSTISAFAIIRVRYFFVCVCMCVLLSVWCQSLSLLCAMCLTSSSAPRHPSRATRSAAHCIGSDTNPTRSTAQQPASQIGTALVLVHTIRVWMVSACGGCWLHSSLCLLR